VSQIFHKKITQSHSKITLKIESFINNCQCLIILIFNILKFFFNRINLINIELKNILQEETGIVSKLNITVAVINESLNASLYLILVIISALLL